MKPSYPTQKARCNETASGFLSRSTHFFIMRFNRRIVQRPSQTTDQHRLVKKSHHRRMKLSGASLFFGISFYSGTGWQTGCFLWFLLDKFQLVTGLAHIDRVSGLECPGQQPFCDLILNIFLDGPL